MRLYIILLMAIVALTFALANSEPLADVDTPIPPSCGYLKIFKYNDLNQNALLDHGEEPLPGFVFNVTSRTSSIYDNFSDNTLNISKWETYYSSTSADIRLPFVVNTTTHTLEIFQDTPPEHMVDKEFGIRLTNYTFVPGDIMKFDLNYTHNSFYNIINIIYDRFPAEDSISRLGNQTVITDGTEIGLYHYKITFITRSQLYVELEKPGGTKITRYYNVSSPSTATFRIFIAVKPETIMRADLDNFVIQSLSANFTASTDQNGVFLSSCIDSGWYNVAENVPANWEATTPNPQAVNVQPSVINEFLFGNRVFSQFSFDYNSTHLLDSQALVIKYKWLNQTSNPKNISMDMIYPSGRTRFNNNLRFLSSGAEYNNIVFNRTYDFKFFPMILNETGTYFFWLNATTQDNTNVSSNIMNFTVLDNPNSPYIKLISVFGLPFTNIIKINTTANETTFLTPIPFRVKSYVNKVPTITLVLSNDTFNITYLRDLHNTGDLECFDSKYNLSKEIDCRFYEFNPEGSMTFIELNYSDATLITMKRPHIFNFTILYGNLSRTEQLKLVPQNTNITTLEFTNKKITILSNESFLNTTIYIEADTRQRSNSYLGESFISIVLYYENPTHINFTNWPNVISKYYEFEPTSDILKFLNWAYIKVYYNESELPPGTDENLLRLWYYNAPSNLWQPEGSVNVIENYVYANITHFSIYSVQAIPYCGDSVCQSSESCSSCPTDCGTCPLPPPPVDPPSGGGGGGDAGGGGFIAPPTTTTSTTSTTVSITTTTTTAETSPETTTTTIAAPSSPTGFVLLSPTNAVIGLAGIAAIAGIVLFRRSKRPRRRR